MYIYRKAMYQHPKFKKKKYNKIINLTICEIEFREVI